MSNKSDICTENVRFAVNQMYFHCRKLNGGEAVRKTTLTNRLFCTVFLFSIGYRREANGQIEAGWPEENGFFMSGRFMSIVYFKLSLEVYITKPT